MEMTFSKEQIIFTLSWLSNCNQGKVFDDVGTAQTHAMDMVVGALQDPEITELTGNFLEDTQTPLWGPYTSSAKPVFQQYDKQGKPKKDSQPISDKFVTNNAMFLARAGKQVDGSDLFVVAIAGTNMDSPGGWFSEDLQVGGALQKLPWEPNGKAMIAPGTLGGVNTLIELGKEFNVEPLAKVLKSAIDSTKKTEIAVTGHSLGGALAPVYALYLKNQLADLGSNIKVIAYPSAGPTPGSQDFVDALSALDGYVATQNIKDIVPHAWDPSTLGELPTLYEELGNPDSIPAYDLVTTSIAWAKAQAGSNNPYRQAAFTHQFNQELYPPAEVNFWEFLEKVAQDPVTFAQLLDNLHAIYKATNKSVSFKDAQSNFEAYMGQAGKQHTVAYASHFFGDDLETKPFRIALEKYINPDEKVPEVVRIELKSVNHFLFLIRNNLPG